MRYCVKCSSYVKKRYCCGLLTVNLKGLIQGAMSFYDVGKLHSERVQGTRELVTAFDCFHDDTQEEFVTGFEFLGRLPEKARLACYGPAGKGKSTFALSLANRLANERGLVAYICAEEGEKSPTMRKKLRLLGITTRNLLLLCSTSEEEIINFAIKYRIKHVFIDSVMHGNFSKDFLVRVNDIIDGFLFYILYQNKEGDAAGESALLYDCDVVIQVEDGVAETKKNRYEKLRAFDIFEGKEVENAEE